MEFLTPCKREGVAQYAGSEALIELVAKAPLSLPPRALRFGWVPPAGVAPPASAAWPLGVGGGRSPCGVAVWCRSAVAAPLSQFSTDVHRRIQGVHATPRSEATKVDVTKERRLWVRTS